MRSVEAVNHLVDFVTVLLQSEREKAVGNRIEGEELAYERGRAQIKAQVIEMIKEENQKHKLDVNLNALISSVEKL